MYRNLLNIIRIAFGFGVLLLGIIGLLVPVLQGWLLILIAVPLISPEHGKKMTAKAKEWKEKGVEWWRKKSEARNSKF